MLFTRFYQHLPSCTTHQQLLASNPGQMTTLKILKPNFTLYTDFFFMSTYVNHQIIITSPVLVRRGTKAAHGRLLYHWRQLTKAPWQREIFVSGLCNKQIYRGKQVKLQNDYNWYTIDAENLLQNSDQNPNGIQRQQIFWPLQPHCLATPSHSASSALANVHGPNVFQSWENHGKPKYQRHSAEIDSQHQSTAGKIGGKA